MDKHIVKEILQGIVEGSVRESNGNFNFRCVLCHDSKRSKAKRRGWVLFKDEGEVYYCFNCGASLSFKRFLKENYPELHSRHVKKRDITYKPKLKEKDIVIHKDTDIEIITDDFMGNSFPLYDKQVDKKYLQLQFNALSYIMKRKLPKEYVNKLRICYKGKYADRLLIPYYDFDGEVYCYQARTLVEENEKGVKYLTNKPEKNNKIYRYYLSNPNEEVYITEGPIDSWFFDNGLSTTGLLKYGTKEFKQLEVKFDKKEKRVWIFDCDKAGLTEAIKYADECERVFCWPNIGVKDINEMVIKNNLTKEQILCIVKENIVTKSDGVLKLKELLIKLRKKEDKGEI